MKTEQMKELFYKEVVTDDFLDQLAEGNIPAATLMTYYRCAIMEIETKFKVLNEQFSIRYDANPIESIKSRLKSPNSILKKMKKMDLPFSLKAMEDNLYDIAGIRVICSFVDDIYLLADFLLQQDDIRLIQRKDYIQHPKENGYRSLHLIVEVPIFLANEKRMMKVEVQLRTIAMDFWASLEHKLRYKKGLDESISKEISNDLLTCATMSADLDDKMQNIRNRINASK